MAVENPGWTDEDELGYQIGDMNGEWTDQEHSSGGEAESSGSDTESSDSTDTQ